MSEHVHLKICIKWFRALGLWRLKENSYLSLLQLAFKLFGFGVLALIILAEYVQMYLLFGKDMQIFAALASVNLLYNVAAVKIYIMSKPAIQNVVSKIKITEVNILEGDNEEVKKIYMHYVRETYFENYTWMLVAYSCDAMFCITPILAEIGYNFDEPLEVVNNVTVYKTRMLPLISWFPFNPNKYHFAAYTFHIIVLVIIPTYIIACNNFMNGLIIFAVGQLKILQAELRSLQGFGKCSSEQVDMEFTLRKSVIYHKAIIRFVQELNVTMKTFLMFDFASCALQIAVLVFTVAVVCSRLQGALNVHLEPEKNKPFLIYDLFQIDFSFALLNTVVYLITALTQVFLFYWYANEIIVESMEVANAAYESQWYLCKESDKRTLIIMMIRAQRPLTLQVGPLYVMSTQTMVAIMRAGYTYATIMRRLYKG